ncbi:alpha/beta fold hydrolase, partial [Stenotrophomonas maltophilia]|uniref:alpha/beta fold hydrolase n=1 Tax=Stenotrophomonas maltophilia TaxID=40324 RepID=UPI0011D27661
MVRLARGVHRRHAGGRVLFAHGFGQTRHAWNATARALSAAGLQTLAYDARGHGDS